MTRFLALAVTATVVSVATLSEANAGPFRCRVQRCYPVPPPCGAQAAPSEPSYGGGTLANQVAQLRSEVLELEGQVTTLRAEVDTLKRARAALRQEIQDDRARQSSVLRPWTDRSGAKKVIARLARVEKSKAHFEREDGKLGAALITDLSDLDQEWIRKWQRSKQLALATSNAASGR